MTDYRAWCNTYTGYSFCRLIICVYDLSHRCCTSNPFCEIPLKYKVQHMLSCLHCHYYACEKSVAQNTEYMDKKLCIRYRVLSGSKRWTVVCLSCKLSCLYNYNSCAFTRLYTNSNRVGNNGNWLACCVYSTILWTCNNYSPSEPCSMRKIVRYIGLPNLITQHNFFVSEIMQGPF